MSPYANCPRTWYTSGATLSGELPPGLRFDSDSGKIQGTPEQAGPWEVTVKFNGLTCGGELYDSQIVSLRITIEP